MSRENANVLFVSLTPIPLSVASYWRCFDLRYHLTLMLSKLECYSCHEAAFY